MAGALPGALMRRGIDVRVCIPCYQVVREKPRELRHVMKGLKVPLGGFDMEADILETTAAEGVPVYLVEREDLYDRPSLYGTSTGDYYDNLERFTFFSRAALNACEALGFEPDIVHCHDWQTGLIPPMLRDDSRRAKSVFTIHNLGYQGLFPSHKVPVTGLAAERFFHPEGMEYWGNISLLKAGVVYSDAVTTVSPTYAEEVQTAEYGMGMEGVMRTRSSSLFGILNGADYTRWNPETDPFIPVPYSPDRMAGKARCKNALLREMGLPQELEHRPVIGLISRLDYQKGLDLVLDMLDRLFSLNAALVILGTGDKRIEDRIKDAQVRHLDRMALRIGFDEPLAHRIIAGSDLFLIPSRYEPCGLTQMYAMKYGTVPVVRATGGLKDTVSAYDPETGGGNGFKFIEEDPEALMKTIGDAVVLFSKPASWDRLRRAGMEEDFSWDRSAERYEALFLDILEGRRSRALANNGPGV